MMHPLAGADRATLDRLLADAGPFRPEKAGTLRAVRAAVAARAPLTAAERAVTDRRRRRAGPIPPPLFVLGHWRSGTTHLYNLLAATGQFAYPRPIDVGLPWNMLLLAPLLRGPLAPRLPEGRGIDAIPVTAASPQEDEFALANMTPTSFLHALYLPGRFEERLAGGLGFAPVPEADRRHREEAVRTFVLKLFLRYRLPPLVKNPAHTAMPATLAALFPGARFVHLSRDPYRTCMSMRNYWHTLFPMLALEPYGHADVDRVVIDTFVAMDRAFRAATAGWGAPRLVAIDYADLDRDPLATLRTVYETLDLPGFAEAEPRIRAALAPVRDFRRNVFADDEAFRARLEAAIAAAPEPR